MNDRQNQERLQRSREYIQELWEKAIWVTNIRDTPDVFYELSDIARVPTPTVTNPIQDLTSGLSVQIDRFEGAFWDVFNISGGDFIIEKRNDYNSLYTKYYY
jgi:hypothetical protein